MGELLRVLILEDRPADRELILNELRRAGFELEWQCVDTEPEFLAHLNQDLDVILADYNMPQFDAPSALRLLREKKQDIPFIVVTGSISEEVAVECIKQGAADYLIKDRLKRLGSAVASVLQEHALRLSKRQAEQALRESEERFRRLAENAQDIIFRLCLTPSFHYEYVSPAAAKITGYAPEEYYADSELSQKIIYADDQPLAESLFQEDASWDKPLIVRWIRKDGAIIWVEQRNVPIFNQTGKLVAVEGIARDITHHKQAEEALRESEERYRSLFEYAPTGQYRSTPEGKIVAVNPALVNMLDYPDRETLMARNVKDVYINPAERENWRELIDNEGEVRGFEIQWRRYDGVPIWVSESARVIHDDLGHLLSYEGSVEDITLRRQAQEEIKKQNRELRLLNRVIAVTTGRGELDTIFGIVCRELAEAFDVPYVGAILFSANDETALVVVQHAAGDQPAHLERQLPVNALPVAQYLLQNPQPLVITDARTGPCPEPVREWLLQRGIVSSLNVPLIIKEEVHGSLSLESHTLVAFSAQDVSLLHRVAEQVSGALARSHLEEFQQLLTTAVEQAAESMFIKDTNHIIVYANPTFERSSGYCQSEIIGQDARSFRSSQHDDIFYQDQWHELTAGRVWQGRMVNRRKDGSLFTTDTTITPVRNQAGEIVNYVDTMRDITREMELEAQFRQAQKLEALGQLAGGVAHDFNNLLTAIQFSTELMERTLRPEDPLCEHVQRIQDVSQRASNLTRQLLSFSRREIVEPKILNLNQVVRDVSSMLERMIGEDIQLKTDLCDDLWPVCTDLVQIEQVIVNLVVNARDAMPHGGDMIMETQNATLDEEYAAQHVDVEPGDYVLLSISDSGMGMSEEVKTRIFEPFFTTKEAGKGTGLGLATVFGIVKQHNGHIWVYSQVGIGTTFKIYLPRAQPSAQPDQHLQAPDKQKKTTRKPGRVETVLVVEDDNNIQELISHVLSLNNYRVLVASSGDEALKTCQQYKARVHVLVTDLVLPGMNGLELANRLQSQRPKLQVLYISGYTDDAIQSRGILPRGTHFLSKPFCAADLVEKVAELLDELT